ncbi:Hypothetical protein NTJ_13721 [Nesidiocoris tenuis]|uniref:Uncharacterized protein n=1 Tax=Nesidiocoris tenuis TaxID=355587 RepID=A0ABN7BB98_9HEMI|nr:Hypothetical protein NTJ_13721 [Nesidiocoris tenuis]
MPGILRQRGPRYPLDKYLPKGPKREERFVKTREPALLKDVNLFRKIESLLKESERIRVPPSQQNFGHQRIHQSPDVLVHSIPNETSISAEDLVAAELYKATYGTFKKPENSTKPSAKGAGDWVDHGDLEGRKQAFGPAIQKSPDAGAQPGPAHQLEPDNYSNAIPIEGKRLEFKHPSTSACIQDRANLALQEPHAGDRPEQKIALLTMSDCSDSIPSESLQSNEIIKKRSPLKKVTMTNACINTDRVNTHVLRIKHDEPSAGDDFASSSKVKSFVVQELPRVNIRGRLVKQNCGFVCINPVQVQNESRNTAVLEINYNDDVLDEDGDRMCPERSHAQQGQEPSDIRRSNQPEEIKSNIDSSLHDLAPSCTKKVLPHTTAGHRLAFGKGLIQQSIAPKNTEQPSSETSRPKIFDTVTHFKEKLSSEMNSGLEPIKLALNEMLSNLKEFCDAGLNDDRHARNVPSASKASSSVVRERVDRMDSILKEEIKTWGFGDQGHYNLLVKAIDDLSDEIRSAVKTFQRQQELKEQTQHFLEGSTHLPRKVSKTMHEADLTQPRDDQPLRIDKLYAIHSFLQESSAPRTFQPSNAIVDDADEAHAEFGQGDAPEGLLNETFTLDRSPSLKPASDECGDSIAGAQNSRADSDKEGIPDNYEEDFNDEDSDHISESVSVPRKNVQNIEKSLGDGGLIRRSDSRPNTVHLQTSGSANGEDSTDAPRFANEEPASSVASTMNVSQINVAAKNPAIQKIARPSAVSCLPLVTRTNNLENQPTVRLTNRNTNAVFELRLPEHLANLNSTLTYNSACSNDEIKLSIGCQAQQLDFLNQQPALLAQHCSHENRHDSRTGFPPQSTNISDVENRRVVENAATSTATRPTQAIHVQHKETQFPSDEINTIGNISTNLMNLFETKMVEIVEGNKLHWSRGNRKDMSVQVSANEAIIQGHPSVERTPTSTPANVDVTPGTDSYDSHAKNLERPSGSLVFSRQMEKEIEKTLRRNRSCPVQMESSFSSVSVPTSLSELPFKSGSTSSSDLAFPLDRKSFETPFDANQLSRLHPAPIFTEDQEDYPHPESNNPQEEFPVDHDMLNSPDISAHLHPRPETILGPQAETQAPDEVLDASDDSKDTEMALQDGSEVTQLVLDIRPYDSVSLR